MTSKKETTAVPIIIFLMIGSYLVSYLLKVYLARQMGSEFYGEYALALQVLLLVSFLTLLGTNAAGTRFLAIFLHDHQDSDTLAFITWNIKFIRHTFIACWVIGIIAFIVMLIFHFTGAHHIDKYHLVIYMFWVAPLSASVSLLCSYLLANNNFLISSFLQGLALNSIFFIYFLITFKLWPNEISNTKIIAVLSAGTVTIAFVCLRLVINKIAALRKLDLKDILLGKISNNPLWFHTSMKLVVSQLTFFVMITSMYLILQFILKDQSQLGFFSASLTIAGVLYVIATAICTPIQPLISHLMTSEQGRSELQHKINNTNLLIMMIIAPLTLLIIYFSSTLLNHFGHAFISAKPTCIILVIGAFIHCFALLGQMILSYAGFAKELMYIKILGLVLTIITGILGTIYFGLIGMAYAYLLYIIVVQIFVTVTCFKKAHVRILTLI